MLQCLQQFFIKQILKLYWRTACLYSDDEQKQALLDECPPSLDDRRESLRHDGALDRLTTAARMLLVSCFGKTWARYQITMEKKKYHCSNH